MATLGARRDFDDPDMGAGFRPLARHHPIIRHRVGIESVLAFARIAENGAPAIRAPRAAHEDQCVIEAGSIDAFGGNPLDVVAGHGRFDPHLLARILEPVDVIVEPEEEAIGHRYGVEDDVAFSDDGIEDGYLRFRERHVSSLEESNAFVCHRTLPRFGPGPGKGIGSRARTSRQTQMLPEGTRITGPALIEEMDSTTLLHPGDLADVRPDGSLVALGGDRGAAGRAL